MKISPVNCHYGYQKNNNQKNASFNAKLFYDGNPIKAFTPKSIKHGKDTMRYRGSEQTVISVLSFNNEKLGPKKLANLIIENPLFGKHVFSHPVKRGNDIMSELDSLTSTDSDFCKDLENRALRAKLIDIMAEGEKEDPEKLNPVTILDKLLDKIPYEEHGFGHKRTNEFKQIAETLLNEVSLKTTQGLEK